MTYQNTTTSYSFADGVLRALNGVGSFFSVILFAIMEASSGNQRLKKIQALQAKSDAELAEMKIERDDIVHEVFKDLYHI
jgi:hypothetical protein